MPQYEYSHDLKVWIKQCSCCEDVVLGTEDQQESLDIFQTVFAPAGPSSGMADGMQSRCWICNSHRRRQLGASRSMIVNMHRDQAGECAICCNEISIARNADPKIHAHVDHDEDTGQIRELLCSKCNTGIGSLKHNPDILRQAADYIEKHRQLASTRKLA